MDMILPLPLIDFRFNASKRTTRSEPEPCSCSQPPSSEQRRRIANVGPPALELGGSFQIVRRQPPEHLRDVLAGRQTRLRGARPREIDKAPGPQFGGRRIAVDFAHPRASLGSPHGIPKSPG